MLVALKPIPPHGPGVSVERAEASVNTNLQQPFPLLAEDHTRRMSNPHRGLPPLPSLGSHSPVDARQPPPHAAHPSQALTTTTNPSAPSSYQSQPLGQLPEAPRSGQSSDDAMRNWLSTKAEEEKRRQEEERTKQEGLKLEQRKIEQSMLRDSLQAGIPPPMVPMVFAGMGRSEAAKASMEWAQHYMSQMSIQQPGGGGSSSGAQALPPAPGGSDSRRDGRPAPGPQSNPYASQQPPPALPAPPPAANHSVPQQPPPNNSFASPYQPQSQNASRFQFQQQDPANQGQRPQTGLSRLNTGGSLAEMQIQPPPPGGTQMPTQPQSHPQSHQGGPLSTPQQHPQPHQTPQQAAHNSSPAIYFHHWQPPSASNSGGNNKDAQPAPPGGKSTHTSPYTSHANSHLRHEYANSPKKRRTGGGSGGGSIGDRGSDAGTTSPQDADSPRFEAFRPHDVASAAAAGRKRGLSNVTRPDSDRSSVAGDRQGSIGPTERKRTISGTPKAEVEVNS